MGGFGQQHQSSTSAPVYQQFPGATGETGYGTSNALFQQGVGTTTQHSPYDQPLSNALLNPSYEPTSAAQQNMLNSLMDLTAGRGAVRGLGSPTQSSLAQSIAPTLEQMNQNQISGLTAARGQDITQQANIMQMLQQLIGLAMPQVVGGNQSQSSGSGYNFNVTAPGGASGGSGKG